MKPRTKGKTRPRRLSKAKMARRSPVTAKITVVIPVLNESRTIANVVKFALQDSSVGEVLVIDDGSIDGTPERAERAGAKIVTSSFLGKGASMEDGLQAAQFDVVLYLDGDLRGLRKDLIRRMTRTLFNNMDGTLLNGRFVLELAHRTGRMDLLNPLLDNLTLDSVARTKRIAAIFAGVPKSTIEGVAKQMPRMPGAVETVVGLRKAGYLVGVVTDSYRMAAETVRRRVFADFTISHVMKFHREKGDRADHSVARHATPEGLSRASFVQTERFAPPPGRTRHRAGQSARRRRQRQ